MKMLLFLPVLRFFELHFDFSGLAWAMLNVLMIGVGILFMLIFLLIAKIRTSHYKEPFRFQSVLGAVLAFGIVAVAGGLGLLVFPVMELSHATRETLDYLIFLYMIVVIVCAIAVGRWKAKQLSERMRQSLYGAGNNGVK